MKHSQNILEYPLKVYSYIFILKKVIEFYDNLSIIRLGHSGEKSMYYSIYNNKNIHPLKNADISSKQKNAVIWMKMIAYI